MKTTIDENGLVQIPPAICAQAGLTPGTEIEVTVEEHGIRLAPAQVGKRATLRGRHAKSEEELAKIDRPYKPEEIKDAK